MEPRGVHHSERFGTWAVQDGLGIVLGRSFFRLAVWVRFFIPLRSLLGSFWVAFGLFLDYLGVVLGSFWGTPDGILKASKPIGYIVINSSTHQPFNLWLVSRLQPGPADCAERLNNSSMLTKFRFLRILHNLI